MANTERPAIDFSGIEDALDWVRTRKNFFAGVALFVVGAIAVANFSSARIRDAAVTPWRSVFTQSGDPWNGSGAAAEMPPPETTAAAFAAYWKDASALADESASSGIPDVGAFPSSPLISAVDAPLPRLRARADKYKAWSSAGSPRSAPPAPSNGSTLTIETDRGVIEITLFDVAAPASVAALRKTVAALKSRYVTRVSPNQWIEIGHSRTGETSSISVDGFTSPPLELNRLSHFVGAVSFAQAPFSKGPFQPELRVALSATPRDDGKDTVLGVVSRGIEVLIAISGDPTNTQSPSLLDAPIEVKNVSVKP